MNETNTQPGREKRGRKRWLAVPLAAAGATAAAVGVRRRKRLAAQGTSRRWILAPVGLLAAGAAFIGLRKRRTHQIDDDGLVCGRCGDAAPADNTSEWLAWNPTDISTDDLADGLVARILVCPECRVAAQADEEIGGSG